MKTRISEKFIELKKANRKALIPFFVPGAHKDLSIEDVILNLEKSGADLIEVGIPFSDPVADGKTIQESAKVALNNGIHTNAILSAISNARKSTQVPILLLVYYNSIFKYGTKKFANACYSAGIDGLIIPDLPFEESDEMNVVLNELPIDLITLVARTSNERMKTILPNTSGFIYCVSSVGVTGERASVYEDITSFLDNIKSYTNTPRAVGFGISTPAQAQSISKSCEGVIVGSALVRRLLIDPNSGFTFINELRNALDK